jgi:sensor histidine kinase regulating citrate/malate metabolism
MKSTSEREQVAGNQGKRGKIVPRFTIGVRFISFVVLVALLSGGIASFVAIKTSRDSLRQEVLHNNLAQADLAAEFASNYVKVIQANVRSFAARPAIVRAVLDNEPEKLQIELSQFVESQTAIASSGIYDDKSIQRVFSQTGVTTIGQSFIDRDYFYQPATTLQPYQGIAVKSRATGLLVAPYGVPILDDQGEFRGVVSTGISLATLSDAIVNIGYSSGTRASIMDARNGGLIIAHSDPQRILTEVYHRLIMLTNELASSTVGRVQFLRLAVTEIYM